MKKLSYILFAATSILATIISCKPEPVNHGTIQLVRVIAGEIPLRTDATTSGIPADASFVIEFASAVDTSTVRAAISLESESGTQAECSFSYSTDLSIITIIPDQNLEYLTSYDLTIGSGIKGASGESFPGLVYKLTTTQGKLTLKNITLNGLPFKTTKPLINIDFKNITLTAEFSDPLNPADYLSFFTFSGGNLLQATLSSNNKTIAFTNQYPLKGYQKYYFTVSSNLTSLTGYSFDGFSNSFYSSLDSTDKYPRITDEELIDLVESQTFRYFWDFGHPSCGLARERNSSGDIVTIGGSGFGVMSLIAGMERHYITRNDGLNRLDKILNFLETCDRFHGAWPHWLNGATGKTIPFSKLDNGADLVETSFMIQGLLAMREYLDASVPQEEALKTRITALWETVEWDWFTRGQEVIYWHWSPTNGFTMNMQIRGYNETLITYVLAASSPTHSIAASAYHKGYASNGSIRNGKKFFGIVLPLGEDFGGPLFFTHYSFLGLDPRKLKDDYADYWLQNVNHSLINMNYCLANPKGYIGYSADCWGLTASDNQSGYSAHSPTNDLGVITPTAAVSSLPYTPEQSMKAIRHFYYRLGDKLWGPYGFYDAFNITSGWWGDSYISIDEGPIVVMIENYRTALLWNLFMNCPEVKAGLTKLGFSY
ncbi:MAG: Ig-like domain-containing protein [Bacteroidia bacterium]|nr:Ig-like domain-containing protein [Bacteroidia bacterium]